MRPSGPAVGSPAGREFVKVGAHDSWAMSVLLGYYWILQFMVSSSGEVQRGGVMYFLYVVPIAAFCALCLSAGAIPTRLNTPTWLTIVYGLIVCAVAFARGDIQTIESTVLFSSAVIVVFACRLSPSVSFLNALFLASIVLNTALFLLGLSIYAPIPGFSNDGELWWRISVFPAVSSSAYFCLIIAFANLIHRDGIFRRLCLMLSLYFLVLSGLRSALIAGFLAAAYYSLVRFGGLRRTGARVAFLSACVLIFVLSLLSSQLLLLLPSLGNETVNVYLFRLSGGLRR